MSDFVASMRAGKVLRELIRKNYATQEEFALDYGLEIRTVSRYINQGINKVDVVQELADFFSVDFSYFFLPHTDDHS